MRSEFWIISFLISIGVIGGVCYNWPHTSQPGAAADFPDSNSQLPENSDLWATSNTSERTPKLWQVVGRGDNYLNVGNTDEALDHYLSVYKSGLQDSEISFRIGLANEIAGQGTHADFFYRRVLQAPDTRPRLRWETLLAQTRNWLSLGRQQEGVEYLCQQFLSTDAPEPFAGDFRYQLELQLAMAFQIDARQLLAPTRSLLDYPYFLECPIDTERALSAIGFQPDISNAMEPTDDVSDGSSDQITPSAQLPVPTAVVNTERQDQQPLQLLQRPTDDASLMVVSIFMQPTAISEFLKDLQRTIGLSFVVSPDVSPFFTGRTVKIRTTATSVAVLLDVVLRPLNLIWEQRGTEIHLVPSSMLSPDELAAHRARQAIRLGRQLIVNFPNHVCRDIVRMGIANLEYLTSNLDAASTILHQLIEEPIVHELKAAAYLNLALLESQMQRFESAVELFYRAVDQSLDHSIKGTAYTHIAHLHLERGNFQPAIVASSRSLTLAASGQIRQSAALDLTRAYLMTGDPHSANRVLFENAAEYQSGFERRLSSVLGAYARSLGTLSPIAKRKAIETLVIALADIRTQELTDSVDRLLIAKAYQSIGLPNRAIDVLSNSVENIENEYWTRRRQFELARLFGQTGKREQAASFYRQIAENRSDLLGMQSQIELAQIELHDKRNPRQCLQLCRQLWEVELPQAIKAKALALMGQAYRELGDIDSSVFCFYGMLPDADHSMAPANQGVLQ